VIIRCQLCNTPIFELRKMGNEVIILIRVRHHGQEHISLVNIAELLRLLEEEKTDDANN